MGEIKLSPRLRPIEISYRKDWKMAGEEKRVAMPRIESNVLRKTLGTASTERFARCLAVPFSRNRLEKQTCLLTSRESCHSHRACPARERACRRTWPRRSDGRCHKPYRRHLSTRTCHPALRLCRRRSEYQCRSRPRLDPHSSIPIAERWHPEIATTAAARWASAAKRAAFPATVAASAVLSDRSTVCSGLEARCPRRSFQWRSPGWRETREIETFSQILQEPVRLFHVT